MKKLILCIAAFIFSLQIFAQQHPIAFLTKDDASFLKANINKYPVLQQSYAEIKTQIDALLNTDIDVPVPKDPAGGYTHDRHKANYTLMFNAGVLYNITGDKGYANFVKKILLKYADLVPTLKNHPEATSSSPGRIFWQALNDANWMLYAGLSYDLIVNELTTAEKTKITNGAFKPEVEYFTTDLKDWFNLLHNHAVWACAGVGAIGIATDNKDYIDMALLGTAKDGKRGFLAQLDNLFSPDGYYTEGPYYTRYAILPYALLANAINNKYPEKKIFQHRDSILYKALNTCLQQTNLDGAFFPMNDALKDKDYTSNELVSAISIFWKAYGPNANWLAVAKRQDRVMLSRGGAAVAAALSVTPNPVFQYKTMESKDGVAGDKGGVSILRLGKADSLTSLLFKYTSHGLSHGHFDKLNINLYDKGNEILTDYGSVRFIGVEQKYGGRYLPENVKYAAQTVAHNTLVVDEKSHFAGDGDIGEKYHSDKQFSNLSNANALVVAAEENNAYKDVKFARQEALLQIPGGNRMLIDIMEVKADGVHKYDMPFQYNGQLISTSFKYKPFTTSQSTLGTANGYQFLWKEAAAAVNEKLAQFTFLNHHTYYTISSLTAAGDSAILTRTGANDPSYNLRCEPAYILRREAGNTVFVNVLEIHGKYDPILEFSTQAYSTIQSIDLLQNTDEMLVVQIMVAGKKLVIAKMKKNFTNTARHQTDGNLTFEGPSGIWYNGQKM